jgi:hypothetical protein
MCAALVVVALVLLQTPTSAARRVILMIGDGMGFKHVEATRNYLGRQLAMEQLPVKYACTTYEWGGGYNSAQAWSNFSYVASGATDSASAGTALSTGVKTDDGNIATTHNDTHRLLTTSEYVRMNAKSAGVDSFTNASTPGTTITNGGASTAFCTGYNTANGYVARWTDIAPGSDGKFKVRAEVAPGGDAQKAYAFDAFKLARTE